jgi:hypothetical protein
VSNARKCMSSSSALLLILVQRADTSRIQSAFNSFSSIPKILPHKRPHHIERRDGRVAAPEFLVSFPGRAAPERFWEALFERRE